MRRRRGRVGRAGDSAAAPAQSARERRCRPARALRRRAAAGAAVAGGLGLPRRLHRRRRGGRTARPDRDAAAARGALQGLHGAPSRRPLRHRLRLRRQPAPAGPPLPAALEPLRAKAPPRGSARRPRRFASALVAEYRPGVPLGWHRDVPDFETVVGISLAGSGADALSPLSAGAAEEGRRALARAGAALGLRAARRGALGLAAQRRADAGAALLDHLSHPLGARPAAPGRAAERAARAPLSVPGRASTPDGRAARSACRCRRAGRPRRAGSTRPG